MCKKSPARSQSHSDRPQPSTTMGIKYESSCALAALLLLYLCLLGRSLKPSIVVGLNKYSHDASCCLIDANSGKILFSQAKERITRRKHDGGGVGSLLRYALRSVGASVEDIACVVSNNHHYRVLPFERKVPYYSALNYIPQDFSDVDNLLAGKKQIELSHHLAHAWGAAGTAPFSEGLVVVMDGMGETFRAMSEDAAGIETEVYDTVHSTLKAFNLSFFLSYFMLNYDRVVSTCTI